MDRSSGYAAATTRYVTPLAATRVSGVEYYQATSEEGMLDELARLDVQIEYLRERMDEIRRSQVVRLRQQFLLTAAI